MHARLNVTWNGANGDMPDPVLYDSTDQEILRWAEEAVRNGNIPGIPADPNASLDGFVVDRFPSNAEVPDNKLFVRPKTPFGA